MTADLEGVISMNFREKRRRKQLEKLKRKYERLQNAGKFQKWKNERPFWGGFLAILAAILILYIPIHLYAIAFIPGSLVFVGFLFGGLIFIVGFLAWFYPQFSTIIGIVIIFLSVLSIMGALGGFLIGSILGIIAGAICVGWEKTEIHDLDLLDDNFKDKKVIVHDSSSNTFQA